MDRRTWIRQATTVAALWTTGTWTPSDVEGAQVVPNSAGMERPQLTAPPGTCDCHHHIYDAARFPAPAGAVNPMQPNAAVEDYRLLRRRLGTARSVIVTPAAYVTDNRVTLDAIKRLGPSARGVAVVRPEVTDAELRALHFGGVRGIRFSLSANPAISNPVTTIDMIEPLAKRVAGLGWHLQINLDANGIAAADTLWNRLPAPLVFDHLGHISGPTGTSHPAYGVMRRLVDKGHAWVKLSVSNDNSIDGPPTYADIVRLGQAFVAAAPERVVWGSNWPHPTETHKPDDAVLFDLLGQWAPDSRIRQRILVQNPKTLYELA